MKRRRRKRTSKKIKRKLLGAVFLAVLGVCEVVGITDLSSVIITGSLDNQNGVTINGIEEELQNSLSQSIVEESPDEIPDFSSGDYIVLNNNLPEFNEVDLENITGENFSDLDKFGRCGTATAMLHKSMMPTEERGTIGQIKPSGWKQEKYEGYIASNPPYLYNRCHLIAYALTGQNANEKNLITGTRYMNATTMLSFEREVMEYLENSDNHVLYRVTPYFKENELLARGVEIEAYSMEDNGEGVCFHVFVYNYQPGIEIDYMTGESWIKE